MTAHDSTYSVSAPWPGDWVEAAACAGLQPLMDDALPGEGEEETEARQWRAARVCARCPVRAECLAWRVATPVGQRVGVSAGRVRRSWTRRGEIDLLAPKTSAA